MVSDWPLNFWNIRSLSMATKWSKYKILKSNGPMATYCMKFGKLGFSLLKAIMSQFNISYHIWIIRKANLMLKSWKIKKKSLYRENYMNEWRLLCHINTYHKLSLRKVEYLPNFLKQTNWFLHTSSHKPRPLTSLSFLPSKAQINIVNYAVIWC